MKASIEVQDNVILRKFVGDVYLDDIINSWKEIFSRFEDLSLYKGILTDLLQANMCAEDKNMSELIDFLKDNMDRMDNMRIAIVMDTPQVTSTIMMDRQMSHLHIKPFSTIDAALLWISV